LGTNLEGGVCVAEIIDNNIGKEKYKELYLLIF